MFPRQRNRPMAEHLGDRTIISACRQGQGLFAGRVQLPGGVDLAAVALSAHC